MSLGYQSCLKDLNIQRFHEISIFFQKFLKNSEISFLSIVVMENMEVLLVQVINTAIAI